MGPILQLIFFGVLYYILACIIGLVFMLAARMVILLKCKKTVSAGRFFWFPITLGPYVLLSVFLNILVCVYIRDVDPPLTDYWSIPIRGELTLGAIDTPDQWNLWPNRDGGEALISHITWVGKGKKLFYGATELDQYFIYRLDSDQKNTDLSKHAFEVEIQKIEGDMPKLQHPFDYYMGDRNAGDLMTLWLILIYPVIKFYRMCRAFWKQITL